MEFHVMDKIHMSVRVLLLVLIMVWFSVCNGNADDEQQKPNPSLWEWQKLRSAYSTYLGLFSPSSIGRCGWYMLKGLLNRAYIHFFPPNIDFRRKNEGEGVTAGEKAGEALANSLVDAAKSAAQTVHNVKNTFSQSHSDSDSQSNRKTHNEL